MLDDFCNLPVCLSATERVDTEIIVIITIKYYIVTLFCVNKFALFQHVPVHCLPVQPFSHPVEQFPVSTEHGTPCLQ